MFNDDENIKNYFVYEYQFLDDLSAILKPTEVYSTFSFFSPTNDEEKVTKTIDEIKKLFFLNGWEGDGSIGIIWVPPFIDIGNHEDTWGTYLWHVKQSNNGTSFIGSPLPLNLKRLKEQNDEISRNDYRNMESISIFQPDVERVLNRIEHERLSFEKELAKLLTDNDETSQLILRKILGYTQCDLVSQLTDFLNDCYLQILIDVLENGNKSHINLRKSSVKMDLSKHTFHEDGITDDDGIAWMSSKMFVTDIWNSYKFEPFDEKYDRLIKPLDFVTSKDLKNFLFKHVIIRNCIQHQDWQLDAPSLKKLGAVKIEIATKVTPIELKEWNMIVLTKEELELLFNNLKTFVSDFGLHVDKKVAARCYRPKRKKENPL